MDPEQQRKLNEIIEARVSIKPLDGASSSGSGELPLNPENLDQSDRRRASWIVLAALLGGMVVVLLTSSSGSKHTTGTVLRISWLNERFARKPLETTPGTALVVENNPTSRSVTQLALERQGYKVLIAQNRKQALKVVEEQKPDTIVLIVVARRMFDDALMVPGAQILITD